jgi:hypothetical protein
MKLTWREVLQIKKPCTEQTTTATNYFVGLADGVQYKPKKHVRRASDGSIKRPL